MLQNIIVLMAICHLLISFLYEFIINICYFFFFALIFGIGVKT